MKERVEVPWRPGKPAAEGTAVPTAVETPATPVDTEAEPSASDASEAQPSAAAAADALETPVSSDVEATPASTATPEPSPPTTNAAPPATDAAEAPAPEAEAQPEELPALPRVLHWHNFATALKEITPSSSEALGSLADLRKWNEEFGEGRKDKKHKSVWGKGKFGFIPRPIDGDAEGKVADSSADAKAGAGADGARA